MKGTKNPTPTSVAPVLKGVSLQSFAQKRDQRAHPVLQPWPSPALFLWFLVLVFGCSPKKGELVDFASRRAGGLRAFIPAPSKEVTALVIPVIIAIRPMDTFFSHQVLGCDS